MARLALSPLLLAAALAACGGTPRLRTAGGGPGTLVPGPDPGPPPEEVIATIERGVDPGVICFAWSPRDAVMCSVADATIQGGATFSIVIVGAGAQRFTWYEHAEGEPFFEVDRTAVKAEAFAAAKDAARAGGFQGWAGNAVAIEVDHTAIVGGQKLRRTRVQTGSGSDETSSWTLHRDTVELDCGGGWKPVAFEGGASPTSIFANELEAPTIRAALLGGKLLFMASVTWGMEGDRGGGSAAELIDPAAVCR